MKSACADNWEDLVDLAEGRATVAAQAHHESCPECAAKLRQLRKVFATSRTSFASAPEELVSRAIGLMPKRVKAGLLRTTLGLAGARADVDDFQVIVSVGEDQARLMYVRLEDGWEVVGRTPSACRPERAGELLEVDESGRFSFRAATLADTGFEFVRNGSNIEVPSAEELLASGS